MKKIKENQDHKKAFEFLGKVADKRSAGKEPQLVYDHTKHKFIEKKGEEKCPHCGGLGGRAYFLDGRVRCWECSHISDYKEWFK